MDDKIIVTNLTALRDKYGAAGVKKIKTAVNKLVAADKKRGLKTKLLALDDAAAMKKLKAPHVSKPTDPKQNKLAIDGVFKKLEPDYLMILGSVDVVPHQDLRNSMLDPGNDDDPSALSDLPYACEAPYSRSPENFTGPSRVIGRLPDLTGGTDPSYLIGLLDTAANYKSRPFSDYSNCFSISAKVWRGSTELSLDNMFGSNSELQLSPKAGPKWPSSLLSRRVHFINCHGAEASHKFLGQEGKKNFPVSHDAKLLGGHISEGTITSAECCFGAQLYDSSILNNGQAGICSTYLENKAYGFFGSTTIAYGPPDGNGAADLICQFFVLQVLGGASLGRAALEARQQFIAAEPQMDPADLKTLAQFILLGDPSIHPVSVPNPHTAVSKAAADDGIDRSARRTQLHNKGAFLAKSQPVASSSPKAKISPALNKVLYKIAAKANMKDCSIRSFSIKRTQKPKSPMAKAMTPSTFHVVLGKTPGSTSRTPLVVAVVAKEVAGKIVSFRELLRR
jgi:hypothetical protein